MMEATWDKLIETLRHDIEHSDHSAIYILLDMLPDDALENYLPDGEREA